jgi:hypothetical protein
LFAQPVNSDALRESVKRFGDARFECDQIDGVTASYPVIAQQGGDALGTPWP